MTDRERWTVYPLLFLTLGVAMRDKIFNLVEVDNVQCKQLIVTDQEGTRQVVVTSNDGGGVVQTIGNAGRPNVIVGNTARLWGLLFIEGGRLLPESIGRLEELPQKPDGEPGDGSESGEP